MSEAGQCYIERLPCIVTDIVTQLAFTSRHTSDSRCSLFSGSGPRFLLSNSYFDRLFLYNTCLVLCGISMGLTNYFHPLLVALVGADCGLDMAADTLPMVCDPYMGQLIYAILYGITRYFSQMS